MADDPVSTSMVPPELSAVRARLDSVDLQLVQLLAARGRLIEDVIRSKRAHAIPVVDTEREDAMLDRIEGVAEAEGLDPRVARQVLRTVIDAFTLSELEEFGQGPS